MQSHHTARALAFLVVVLGGAAAASGEQLTCDAPCELFPPGSPYACPTRSHVSYPWQDHFFALSRLGNHWMPTFGDGDSMSVPFSWDQGGFYPYGSDGFRETWYIARDGAANRGPFYRHYSSSLGNHRDSPSPSESGYTLEGTLGYPWTADLGGMKPLRRLYNSSITDHRTWLFDPPLPPGYVVNATWWPGGASPRLGYQRFANLPDQCSAVAAGEAAGSVLQNSKLRVRFNKIWGNAIGELTHLASGQDLVSSSIGDMMQSVIFYGGPDSSHQLNPTQSGGADTFNYGATKRWAGSPVLSQTVVSGSPPYMTTDVRPLNFDHDFFDGNDPWSPLLWRGLFRLTTTVGCKLSGVLQEDVIKIRHEATKDADAPFTTNPVNMFQTSWFLMEPFGDCRSANVQIDLVNTATGAMTPYGSMACNQSFSFPGGADKAIRIVGVNPSLAIGFVRLGTPDGYSASIGAADSQQPPSSQRLVVNGWKFHNLNAGVWEREEVFWVFGTPAGVLSRLMQLRSDGGDCLN